MRRPAPVDPFAHPHCHPQVTNHASGPLEYRQRERKGANDRKEGRACRCSLFTGFALLVALCFVLVFYSAIHLSTLEKSTLFLNPETAALFEGFSVSHPRSDEALGVNDEARPDVAEKIQGILERRPRKTTTSTWIFSAADAEEVQRHFLRTTGRASPLLTAFVEPPLRNDTATLPLRTHGPDDLRIYTYPQVKGCKNLQATLPTVHPIEMDDVYGSNVFNRQPLFAKRFDYAKDACPVDADPFLPWIHDVFPSNEYVEFIAHNKRKCNTDTKVFQDDLRNLEPQVAIMQPVPVKRITNDEAQSIAPELWPGDDEHPKPTTRYRLVSHEEADYDGRETRFICRFFTYKLDKDANHTLRKVVLGETLSVYPYNYEFANYKKPGSKPMLTPLDKGKDEQIWNSVLHFRCPIPVDLQPLIALGESVVNDEASIYLDLVPIRTRSRRTLEGYMQGVKTDFRPNLEWGEGQVLPLNEASGRYSNIPICRPPILEVDSVTDYKGRGDASIVEKQGQKMQRQQVQRDDSNVPGHYLVGCLWASASFTTRGNSVADTSTSHRLLEWLAYHLYISKFDHIYVYDNTWAFTNLTSLAVVTDLFPSGRVTRIPWPHRVCNNNRPMHSNPGERSSQYAAEASCRVRYGPHASWLAGFDADEYLIPQGHWRDLQHWLREGVDNNTHILSFFQTRAHPIADLMEPYADGHKCGRGIEEAKCLAKRENLTFMETYACESTPLPKPDFGWRAKKQIFRPWYVLNHYVHYSVVTKRLLDAPNEASPRFVEKFPYERRVDELSEGFMLHCKTTSPEATLGWKEKCTRNDSCPVGIPWPLKIEQIHGDASLANSDGLKFNCYQHERVVKTVLPKLKSIVTPLLQHFHARAKDTAWI